MGYQGYILSNSQIIRKNVTQLIFQGRLGDGRRFHWTVTRPGLVFFIDRDKTWTPPGAFRKSVDLLSLRGKPVDALYFQTTSELTRARGACESRNTPTYEADVILVARFLMERFIKGGVSFESKPVNIENDTVYFKGPAGLEFAEDFAILPSIIEELWQERENAKQLKDTTLSQAVKIIMNSFYGVLGTPGCRFYDPRLAVF